MLTGQIEHWARLGKAVEPLFTKLSVAAIKKSGGDLTALEDDQERVRVLGELYRLRLSPPFAATAAFLKQTVGPIYEVNPEDPDGIVQVHSDGSRIPGRMVSRVFVPSKSV